MSCPNGQVGFPVRHGKYVVMMKIKCIKPFHVPMPVLEIGVFVLLIVATSGSN